MKVNRKVLVAAAALAMGAGAAHADPISYTGIFFSAYDSANNTSIIVNLNLGVADFRANPNAAYTLGGSGLSGLQSWMSTANTSAVSWNVYGVFDDGTGGNIPPSNLYGGVSTSRDIESIAPDERGWGSFTGLDATVLQTRTFLEQANYGLVSSNSWTTSGQGAYIYTGQNGGVSFDARGNVGDVLGFYDFGADPDNSFYNGVYSEYAGTWSLTFNGGQAALAYTGGTAPPVVPIPAAVWLLGSGLLGLIGIGRRKQVAVA